MRASLFLLTALCSSWVWSQEKMSTIDIFRNIEYNLLYLGQMDTADYYRKLLPKTVYESLPGYDLYNLAISQTIDSIDLSPQFNLLTEKYKKDKTLSLRAQLLYIQYLLRNDRIIEADPLLEKALIQEDNKRLSTDQLNAYILLITTMVHQMDKRGDLLKAHTYAKQAEGLADQSDLDIVKIAVYRALKGIYQNMASDQLKIADKDERQRYLSLAKDYLTKSIQLSEKVNAPKLKSISYYDMALFQSADGKSDSANYYIQKSINISRKAGMYKLASVGFTALTNFYLYQAKTTHATDPILAQMYLDTAGITIDSAAKYANLDTDQNVIINLKLQKASLLIGQNKFKQAIPYVDKAISEAIEINSHVKLRLGYHNKYLINKFTGVMDSALIYYQKSIAERDSILSQENRSKIDELNEKYENEKLLKENIELISTNRIQNLQITKKNLYISLLAILLTGIPFIIYLLYRKKTITQEQRTLKAEQKLLRSQLNPHFLYNALNAIQQYIYQQKDPTIVADYLAKFSRLTRQILLYSREEFIPIADEIKFLSDYIALQQIRFDVPFSYEIEVDPAIIDDDIMIPPMFTQPFLENSIEHGILTKRGEGMICVRMKKEDNNLVIEIEDNGVGINQSQFEKRNKEHRSLAMEITRERLSNISKIEKTRTNLKIRDLSDINDLITGTIATLTLPLIHE